MVVGPAPALPAAHGPEAECASRARPVSWPPRRRRRRLEPAKSWARLTRSQSTAGAAWVILTNRSFFNARFPAATASARSPTRRCCGRRSTPWRCGWPEAGRRGTVSRKRAIFYNALEYAVELGHLPTNPISAIKWRAPKLTEAVNPRVVINHGQARALLDAVGRAAAGAGGVLRGHVLRGAAPGRGGGPAQGGLDAPPHGMGRAVPEHVGPAAGRAWSEGGTRREPRQLKHRGVDEVRIVPCPPELTALLHTHLAEHGTAPDGRLFRGTRGGPLAESVYGPTGAGPGRRALPRGVRLTARAPALRPAARCGVDLAQRRRAGASGGAVGRAQRRRPAAGLRQVHRRPGGRRPPPGRGGLRAGPDS